MSYIFVSIKGEILNILLLSIPLSIRSGVVTAVKTLYQGLSSKNINVVILTHWWNCGFEEVIRYTLFSKNFSKTFIKSSDNHGRKIAKTVSFRPVRVKKLLPEEDIKEAGITLVHEVLDCLEKNSFKPDIIHAHTHTFMYDGVMETILERTNYPPLVYTLHAVIPYIKFFKLRNIFNLSTLSPDIFFNLTEEEINLIKSKLNNHEKAQEKMIEISDKVITIAKIHEKAFHKLYPHMHDKCITINNGTDFIKFSNDKEIIFNSMKLKQKLAPNNELLLLYCGRIEKSKRVEKLLQAFNLILNEYKNAKLLIIGESEFSRNKLLSSGLKKENLNKVILIDWVKNRKGLASYYKAADIMIQPVMSKELFPLVVLEAMCMKIPVISSPSEITFGRSDTPESIFNTVKYIIEHPQEVEEKIEKAYETVKKEYTVSVFLKKTITLYKDLINLRCKEKNIEKLLFIVRKRREEKIKKVLKEVQKRKKKKIESYLTKMKKPEP